jgi:hypothetical protein
MHHIQSLSRGLSIVTAFDKVMHLPALFDIAGIEEMKATTLQTVMIA